MGKGEGVYPKRTRGWGRGGCRGWGSVHQGDGGIAKKERETKLKD